MNAPDHPAIDVLLGTMALALGAAFAWRLKTAGPMLRVVAFLLPLLALWFLLECAVEWRMAPESRWNGARLAPAYALTIGAPIYPGVDDGPLLGNIYGPGLALVYMPVTVCELPSTALISGSVLTTVFLLLPACAWLWVVRGRGAAGAIGALLGCVVFAWIALSLPSMRYAAFWIHVDAPAIGLGLIACALVARPDLVKNNRALYGSAACSVLAFWTKQTAAPLLLALPLHLWLSHGRSVAWRHLLASACMFLVVWLMAGTAFGFSNLWLNMVSVLAVYPWFKDAQSAGSEMAADTLEGKLHALMSAGAEFMTHAWMLMFVLAALVAAVTLFQGRNGVLPLRSRPWWLPVCVSMWMLPLALMGRIKAGGDINAYSHVLAYVSVALAMVQAELCMEFGKMDFKSKSGTARALVISGWAVVCLVMLWQLQPLRRHDAGAWKRTSAKLEDQALAHVKAHPGETYFPWNPLVHLMGEKMACHFDCGVFDRHFAGFEVNDAHLRKFVPARLRYVAVVGGLESVFVASRLGPLETLNPPDSLKNWSVYALPRSVPASAASTVLQSGLDSTGAGGEVPVVSP